MLSDLGSITKRYTGGVKMFDDKALMSICKEFEKKNGKGSIFMAGGSNSILDIPRISTCIDELDEITGGGLPVGRIIEIFGAESSGKTSLAYWLASLYKRSAYFPIEGTYDERRALSIGVKRKRMLVCRCNTGEEVLNMTMKLARAGMPLIIIDSVPACQPKEDIEKVEKDVSTEFRMGGVARLFSKMLPALGRACEKSGSILILINQTRANTQAVMFGDPDTTPGGRAIKFATSIRAKVARKAWIEIPNRNPKISSTTLKVGMIMKIRIVKSKVSNPFGECEIPFIFDRGFVSHDQLKEVRAELMRNNKRSIREDEDED
jgi:recombination protein RecA